MSNNPRKDNIISVLASVRNGRAEGQQDAHLQKYITEMLCVNLLVFFMPSPSLVLLHKLFTVLKGMNITNDIENNEAFKN